MNTIQPKGITSDYIQWLFLKTYRALRVGEINIGQAAERRKILSALFKITAHTELLERLERIERVMRND